MAAYEARRLENIKRNQSLVKDLGLQDEGLFSLTKVGSKTTKASSLPSTKRRKLENAQPTRTSVRIANAASRPTYASDDAHADESSSSDRKQPREKVYRSRNSKQSQKQKLQVAPGDTSPQNSPAGLDLESVIASWSSWTPSASPPSRDDEGNYHFDSHPEFTPNKSPEAIIREGSFGGSYWRPLYSRHLRTTISEDWRELPPSWTDGVSVEKYLTAETYDAEINKYGVTCGQSIEEWEAAGWIAHAYDVRGWFQWYCRFWLGRRCADDERQISRWRKCVGRTGRWRRTLLKKYVQMGVRSVTDEGDESDGEERRDPSPVVHQTCHHWAWEVRQEALDQFWENGT